MANQYTKNKCCDKPGLSSIHQRANEAAEKARQAILDKELEPPQTDISIIKNNLAESLAEAEQDKLKLFSATVLGLEAIRSQLFIENIRNSSIKTSRYIEDIETVLEDLQKLREKSNLRVNLVSDLAY